MKECMIFSYCHLDVRFCLFNSVSNTSAVLLEDDEEEHISVVVRESPSNSEGSRAERKTSKSLDDVRSETSSKSEDSDKTVKADSSDRSSADAGKDTEGEDVAQVDAKDDGQDPK